MPKRRRINISKDDATATIVTRRVVNTYSRVEPRQTVNKHHFLTPETPYEVKYELPSHLLQGSDLSSTISQAYSEEKSGQRDKSAMRGTSSVLTPMSLPEFSSTSDLPFSSEKRADANTQHVKSSNVKPRSRKGHVCKKRKGRRKVTDNEISRTCDAKCGKTTAQSCNLEPVSMEMTCEGSKDELCGTPEPGPTDDTQEKMREFMEVFTSEMKHLQVHSKTSEHQSLAQTDAISLLSCDPSLTDDPTLNPAEAQDLGASSSVVHVEVASDIHAPGLKNGTSKTDLSIPVPEVGSEVGGPVKEMHRDPKWGSEGKRRAENCRTGSQTRPTKSEAPTRESGTIASIQGIQKEPPETDIHSSKLGGSCSDIRGVYLHTPMAKNHDGSGDPRDSEYDMKTADCLDEISASETHTPMPKDLADSDVDCPEDSGSDIETQRGKDDYSGIAESRAATAYECVNPSSLLQLSCSNSAESSSGEDAQTIIKGLQKTMKLNVQSLFSKPVRKLRKTRIESQSTKQRSMQLSGFSPDGQTTPTVSLTARVHGGGQREEPSSHLDLFFSRSKMTPISGVASLSPVGGSGSQSREKPRSAVIEQTPDLILATKFPNHCHPKTSTPVAATSHVGRGSEGAHPSDGGSTMERLLEFDEVGLQASQALEEPTPHRVTRSGDQNGSFGFSEFFGSASKSVELPKKVLNRSKPSQSGAPQTVNSPISTSRECGPLPARNHKKPYRNAKKLKTTSAKTSSRRKKLCPPIVHYRWNYTMGSTYTTSCGAVSEQMSPSQTEEREYPVCILALLSQEAPPHAVYHLQSCDHNTTPVDVLVRYRTD